MAGITIRQFIEKHGKDFNINYAGIHRLILKGYLLNNIHYKEFHRGVRRTYLMNESAVIAYLKTGH